MMLGERSQDLGLRLRTQPLRDWVISGDHSGTTKAPGMSVSRVTSLASCASASASKWASVVLAATLHHAGNPDPRWSSGRKECARPRLASISSRAEQASFTSIVRAALCTETRTHPSSGIGEVRNSESALRRAEASHLATRS